MCKTKKARCVHPRNPVEQGGRPTARNEYSIICRSERYYARCICTCRQAGGKFGDNSIPTGLEAKSIINWKTKTKVKTNGLLINPQRRRRRQINYNQPFGSAVPVLRHSLISICSQSAPTCGPLTTSASVCQHIVAYVAAQVSKQAYVSWGLKMFITFTDFKAGVQVYKLKT